MTDLPLITGTAGADTLNLERRGLARVEAGGGNDLMVARLDGTYVVSGGAGNDGMVLRARLSATKLFRTEEGALIIQAAVGDASITLLPDMERVRFDDGTVLTFADLLARATPVSRPVEPALPTPSPDPAALPQTGGAIQAGVFGTSAAEALEGTALNEMFYSNGGADVMTGRGGDDRYYVGDAARIVELPGGGTDLALYTGSRTYYLPAGVENVTILTDANRPLSGPHIVALGSAGGASAVGNELANLMMGSKADNVLDGRAGADRLTGGEGRDVFVFGRGYGADVVTDFTPGQDKIRLVSGFTSFGQLRLTDTPQGVTLRTDLGDTLLLAGRQVAELTARDFEFTVDLARYRIAFNDDFDGFQRLDGRTGTDGGTWRTRMAQGDGSMINGSEPMRFVDPTFKGLGLNPFSVADGVLKIEGSWRPELTAQLDGREFVSGLATTEGTYTQLYGYFEARLKVGDWAGGFPAFWMLPADHSWPPEIDIMEQLGRDPGSAYQMGNWAKFDPTGFNIFSLEWTPERLAWFVNGEMTHVVYDHSQHKPMYMLLNYGLGGTWAGEIAKPAAPGQAVGELQVDWVRAWALKDSLLPAQTDAVNAPLVTVSLGDVAVGGVPAAGDAWRHLADASGKLVMQPEDFAFASRRDWMEVRIDNDRATDSYALKNSNGWGGLNLQLEDDDGGRFTLDGLRMVELRLGGASTVNILNTQFGLVQGGADNDSVTVTAPRSWKPYQPIQFELRGGGGDDVLTGWASATNRAFLRLLGEEGRDTLTGGTGDDFLDGGRGDDRLAGGPGRDSFQFRAGEGGEDLITDFTPGEDRLALTGFAPATLSVQEVAGGVWLNLNGQGITVLGLAPAGVTAAVDWL